MTSSSQAEAAPPASWLPSPPPVRRAHGLIELKGAKGYTGGVAVEGGTALHSFYNLWTAFPGVEKRQLVAGIPQEIVDRLAQAGGTTGHAFHACGL